MISVSSIDVFRDFPAVIPCSVFVIYPFSSRYPTLDLLRPSPRNRTATTTTDRVGLGSTTTTTTASAAADVCYLRSAHQLYTCRRSPTLVVSSPPAFSSLPFSFCHQKMFPVHFFFPPSCLSSKSCVVSDSRNEKTKKFWNISVLEHCWFFFVCCVLYVKSSYVVQVVALLL